MDMRWIVPQWESEVQWGEDWKKKKNHACFVVMQKKNKTKKNIHFKTYQYLIYFSGNNFILCPDFVTSGEKEIKNKKIS